MKKIMLVMCSILLIVPIFLSANEFDDSKKKSKKAKNPKKTALKIEVQAQKELTLTANEVFFTPSKTLRNNAVEGEKGTELNQFKVYSHVSDWKNTIDTLVWGVDAIHSGNIKITPLLGVPSNQEGSVIEVLFAGESKTIELKSTGGLDVFTPQETLTFSIPSSGRYELKMSIKSLKSSKGDIAYVKGVDIVCDGILKVKPVILRWRPSAVHAGWGNSKKPGKIIMAVHENTIITTGIDMYAPITTPFGYNGSSWNTDGQQFGGINFSLWSPIEDEGPLPSVESFSHLIAVGGKGARIDGFNHEGTGVKIRGMNPYENVAGIATQVLAMQKVPGVPYDTYYSYYLDLETREWKFYGCGKKYNKKGNFEYMKTGAFVEQPGRAEKQRSGHILREVQYRGWLMDEDKNWYPIDQMITGKSGESDNSFKKRGIKGKKFFMQMGGFGEILEYDKQIHSISLDNEPMPDFLSGEKLTDLFKLPATIEKMEADKITSNSAMVNFDVTDIGTKPEVTLYFGESDALTFVDGNKGNGVKADRKGILWDHIVPLSNKTDGKISYELTNLKSKTKYYYRLQIINDEGETWSFDTQSFKTK